MTSSGVGGRGSEHWSLAIHRTTYPNNANKTCARGRKGWWGSEKKRGLGRVGRRHPVVESLRAGGGSVIPSLCDLRPLLTAHCAVSLNGALCRKSHNPIKGPPYLLIVLVLNVLRSQAGERGAHGRRMTCAVLGVRWRGQGGSEGTALESQQRTEGALGSPSRATEKAGADVRERGEAPRGAGRVWSRQRLGCSFRTESRCG